MVDNGVPPNTELEVTRSIVGQLTPAKVERVESGGVTARRWAIPPRLAAALSLSLAQFPRDVNDRVDD
jgi:hypothetical protein